MVGHPRCIAQGPSAIAAGVEPIAVFVPARIEAVGLHCCAFVSAREMTALHPRPAEGLRGIFAWAGDGGWVAA